MSMGFLVPRDEAVVWRGPMLHGAVTQFLRDTQWGHLDYLIIDMPPGTGDIALTLSQLLPLTGAVVVCTPQDVALAGRRQGDCDVSQGEYSRAGHGREHEWLCLSELRDTLRHLWRGEAQREARRLNVPFLGDVPIHMSIRQRGDAGQTLANFLDDQVAPSSSGSACSLREPGRSGGRESSSAVPSGARSGPATRRRMPDIN